MDCLVKLYGLTVLSDPIAIHGQYFLACRRGTHDVHGRSRFNGGEVEDTYLALDGGDQSGRVDDINSGSWEPQGVDGKVVFVTGTALA